MSYVYVTPSNVAYATREEAEANAASAADVFRVWLERSPTSVYVCVSEDGYVEGAFVSREKAARRAEELNYETEYRDIVRVYTATLDHE